MDNVSSTYLKHDKRLRSNYLRVLKYGYSFDLQEHYNYYYLHTDVLIVFHGKELEQSHNSWINGELCLHLDTFSTYPQPAAPNEYALAVSQQLICRRNLKVRIKLNK